ncbi:MAG: hypothetical protein HND56_01365 [Pseudomonadota bacterium]|nr:hypothetical protein [Pseudomonadota bacterium]QKK04412.1 MAG: hypothetical protein HND56_01365 [Pseudomonadota bacterium]|tara:strand:+ start:215 stop:1189 length:975 start_codon:yes stop_codon:yes gene_type:complete
MSQDKFNGEALPKYENHAQVFKATQAIAAKIAVQEQPSMEEQMEMMFDPSKAQGFMQKQKETLTQLVDGLEKVKKGVSNSDALSEDLRDAFTGMILAQQGTATANMNMMDLSLAAMTGAEPSEEQAMQTMIGQQMAQENTLKSQKNLLETLYGFQSGQTLADVAVNGDMTIEDFERYNAMVQYSANMDEVMKDVMPALQTGDTSAVSDIVDIMEDVAQKVGAVKAKVSSSTAMTDEQKTACLQITEKAEQLYSVLSEGLTGIANDDETAAMGMMMSLPQVMQETLPLQAKYYDVLDTYYQAKATSNDNTVARKPSAKKPGTGNN